MAFLELVAGHEPGTKHELSGDRVVIGRSADCDLPLDVAAVSRRHVVILQEQNHYFIEDLGSRNGTYLNDQKIEGRRPLRNGDEFIICDQRFRFQGDEPGGLLSGVPPNLAQMIDDDGDAAHSGVMATLDMGSASAASWSLSAKPEVKLAALIEISNGLAQTLSVDEILPKLLDSLFKIFVQADRGFVVMRPKEDGPLVPVAVKCRRSGDEEQMRISRTIVEEAVTGRKAILSADASSDERFGSAQSIADFSIRSMMCAPMVGADGNSLGVIQIDTNNQRSRFADEDLEVLAAVAGQAAAAIDNAKMHEQVMAQQALQRDLDLAKRMQRALLPSSPPDVPGYFFFDYYQSARQVGGDYYDYVELPGERFAVIVGDVAGKGVSAALLMARLSSDVRFLLASEADPAQAMFRINNGFARNDWQDKFVTMIVAVVDPQASELILVNAGHMPPLLRSGSGEVIEIGDAETGLPLGVSEDYEYESYKRVLEAGDYLTIFTDGLSEAMNSQRDLYGLERLAKQVATPGVELADLGEHILKDIREFVDGYAQSDDMCMSCFGRQ